MKHLPIYDVLNQLQEVLSHHNRAILAAPPGAGKTTAVPLALLDEPWLEGRRILMLEPRRMAAKSAAVYMASQLGEQAGQTVGYRMRNDSKVSRHTRIEVITEGILTRLLQDDPALEDTGAVIFDEFHERSLHADLGLALCLQSQSILRDDLRLLVMSATLDTEAVSELLDGAPVIQSEGRAYPVETHYRPVSKDEPLWKSVARQVEDAFRQEQGNMLVFLPGAGEIRRTMRELESVHFPSPVTVAPLYGQLPQAEQEKAIMPSPDGTRKVVLATSIAETSLTVEGIRIVVDSGWSRVPKFSPRTGMGRLETVPLSKASAEQRRGRAGRLEPGVCYRMWSRREHDQLPEQSEPEMKQADLSALALELAGWGIDHPSELRWLDPPPEAAYRGARQLLSQLGVLNEDGRITEHGKEMAKLGTHPRLAHMMLKARSIGQGWLACVMAAMLGEKDFVRNGADRFGIDLQQRIEYLLGDRKVQLHPSVDAGIYRRILEEADRLGRELAITKESEPTAEHCGLLAAFAYPDRIGLNKGRGQFLLSSGRRAVLPSDSPLAIEPYIVAPALDDRLPDSRIYLAATLLEQVMERNLAHQIQEYTLVGWDEEAQAVKVKHQWKIGSILWKERSEADPNPERVQQALLAGIRKEGISIFPWSANARRLQKRMQFLRQMEPDIPDVSDEALLDSLEQWAAPYVAGMKSKAQLQRLNMADILRSLLTWEQQRLLEEEAPDKITVPSGSRITIDYEQEGGPVLAVRLQELFGWTETPRIGKGKVPLLLHILSPANRPVQITRDLAHFWQNTYFDVKKDLKGRYPKHVWPEDPLTAQATRRTKPKPT
ncbi:ATP-dependent helicase HrpB [Marinicrinis lubricantis]|uniref:ATP-dependent helicase HrpB n=1 Tax=Marinicrinis lubricantis TaxID=2086470 RepID=A0ABW1IVK2_9BACL